MIHKSLLIAIKPVKLDTKQQQQEEEITNNNEHLFVDSRYRRARRHRLNLFILLSSFTFCDRFYFFFVILESFSSSWLIGIVSLL